MFDSKNITKTIELYKLQINSGVGLQLDLNLHSLKKTKCVLGKLLHQWKSKDFIDYPLIVDLLFLQLLNVHEC